MTDPEALFRWSLGLFLVGLTSVWVGRPLLGRRLAPLALPLFFLVWTYLYWIWGSLFVLPAGGLAAWVSGSIALVLFLIFAKGCRGAETGDRRAPMIGACVFIFAFAFALTLRSLMPDLANTEKFTDLAIFQAGLVDRHFPPVDRWLSGFPINYYYFGQLLFVPFTQIAGVPPEWAFNLAVATVAAFGAMSAFAVVLELSSSRRAAFVASGLTLVISNWSWIREGGFWWNSSRSIRGSIAEFPYFSLLVGDFHAHFIALPWLSLAVGLVLLLRAQAQASSVRRMTLVVLTALAVGVHYPMNAWGLPVVALLVALVLGRNFLLTLAIGALSAILYLPYWLSYQPPVSSIQWVPTELRSSILPYVLHWGPFLSPLVLLVGLRAYRKRVRYWIPIVVSSALMTWLGGWVSGLVTALLGAVVVSDDETADRDSRWFVSVGLLLMLSCEFFYFKDSYTGEFRRMNTVFRFFHLAWWIMALGLPAFLIHRSKEIPWGRWPRGILFFAWLSLGLVYPVIGTSSRVGSVVQSPTLDGMAYWKTAYPSEREVIEWIREYTAPNDVLWEASGPPYKEFARISSFSGRPTVLGWANHEWVWRRNGFELTSKRQREIDDLNQAPTQEKLTLFVQRYGVRWIVEGEVERRVFSASLRALIATYPVAFATSGTSVYEVVGPSTGTGRVIE